MSNIHMTSMPVDLRELRRLSAINGFSCDEGRALHHFLVETFGRSAMKTFRLMTGRNGSRQATLYAYSALGESELRATAAESGQPELLDMLGVQHLKAKAMPETWVEGRRLAFDVLVRPVRRLRTELAGWSRGTHRTNLNGSDVKPIKAAAEVDAFLVEALRASPDGPRSAAETPDRENTYRNWLCERLKGVELDNPATRLIHYERRRVSRGSLNIEGPDAIFHGELTIADPNLFAEMLARGVGRHTAYGYGMLLLRPAAR